LITSLLVVSLKHSSPVKGLTLVSQYQQTAQQQTTMKENKPVKIKGLTPENLYIFAILV
jgi:hypothetical protein